MPQIDPLVFGAAVFALVGLFVIAPKFFGRYDGPTADDVYLDSLPSRYEPRITVPDPVQASALAAPPEPLSTPPGAPRAIAPTRQVAPSTPPPASSSTGLEPLRLPVD